MSAGGLSYHGVVGYGKATLPSVVGYSTNLNILKDPPKMVMTRRRDKVGETSSITQMQQESGDRACEAIQVYARGVNPFVKVSYSNAANNGGQRTNGFSNGGQAGRQAYLPHSIGGNGIGGGAFRPPVRSPQSLLPLSRLPRTNTSEFTKPGFADFTRKMMCPQPAAKTAGVKTKRLRASVRPTAVYKIETPAMEPFEVRYVIQNPVKAVGSGRSGTRTLDRTQQYVGTPTRPTIAKPLHADAQTNLSENRHINNSQMDTGRFTQEVRASDVRSKLSQNIQAHSIDLTSNVDVRTQDLLNVAADAPLSGHTKIEYIHGDKRLERALPAHQSRTNRRQNIHVRTEVEHQRELKMNRPVTQGSTNHGSVQRQAVDNISSRQYRLNPTVSPGGFDGRAGLPALQRGRGVPTLQRGRNALMDRVAEMQRSRR